MNVVGEEHRNQHRNKSHAVISSQPVIFTILLLQSDAQNMQKNKIKYHDGREQLIVTLFLDCMSIMVSDETTDSGV